MLTKYQFIDLTHKLDDTVPTWDGSCGFVHDIKLDYHQCEGEAKFRVHKLTTHAGLGTHMDAPAHCFEGEKTIGDLPFEQLIRPVVVIDTSDKMVEDYKISLADIKEFEQHNRAIKQGDVVLFHTGWGQYFTNPGRYRNEMLFPTISEDVALLLLERDVAAVAIDTLSPDLPDSGFPVHRHMLGAGKYIIENIANGHLLPPVGSYIFSMPLYGSVLTEAPARVFAAIER